MASPASTSQEKATRSRLSETLDIEWPEEERLYLTGNDALAEAAIRAGCRFFAGYPITPSSEILERMAKRLPEVGGVCMFPGTEIEGVTMVQGAAGSGVRAMTATSSTAFSLMQETIAEAANGAWPIVVVNMCRGALQGDYYQTVKGGGHGDYKCIVLAPHTGQDMVDLTYLAFDLADRYRHPVMIFGDTVLAMTTETVVFKDPDFPELPAKTWVPDGTPGRDRRSVTYLGHSGLSTDIAAAMAAGRDRFEVIAERETHWEEQYLDDADVMVVAFGSAARQAKHAIAKLRAEGIRIGILRPITLSPFPYKAINEASRGRKAVICFELNDGQMVHDVRSAVFGQAPVEFVNTGGRSGLYVTDEQKKEGGGGFGTVPHVEVLAQTFRDTVSRNIK